MALVLVPEANTAGTASADATPKLALSPGDRWLLLSQSIHVSVSLKGRGSLRGTAQFRIRLSASTTEIRLNCSPTCVVHRCLLDGELITTSDGRAVPQPVVPVADSLAEAVVPPCWRRTRDLVSFQRCHGAATFIGSHQQWDEPRGAGFHYGELAIPLPAAFVTRASPRTMDGSVATDGPEVTLSVEYSVSEPRGGVHFVRSTGCTDAVYAHTSGEWGAPRRWMPCVDCPQVRCPITLHVTADASLQVHASGRCLGVSSAPVARSAAQRQATWGFALDEPTLAAQVGFVVGHLSSVPHPTLPNVTLILGTRDAYPSAGVGTTSAGAATPADAAAHPEGDAARSPSGMRLWPQLLYLARHLPSTLAFLHRHLLEPSVADAAEARLAAEEAAASAASSGGASSGGAGEGAAATASEESEAMDVNDDDGVNRTLALANSQKPCSHHVDANGQQLLSGSGGGGGGGGGGEGGGGVGGGVSNALAARAPYARHVLVVLEGAREETASFGGLVLLSSHWLHSPEALEPARPSRIELGRALGRSWLLALLWLDGWREAWLLMALEGRLVHEYTRHEFGSDEAGGW